MRAFFGLKYAAFCSGVMLRYRLRWRMRRASLFAGVRFRNHSRLCSRYRCRCASRYFLSYWRNCSRCCSLYLFRYAFRAGCSLYLFRHAFLAAFFAALMLRYRSRWRLRRASNFSSSLAYLFFDIITNVYALAAFNHHKIIQVQRVPERNFGGSWSDPGHGGTKPDSAALQHRRKTTTKSASIMGSLPDTSRVLSIHRPRSPRPRA
jgi:hypothetical protein